MTAAVWTYMQYEKRFVYYPDLSDGLSLLAQDERLKGELILLQQQFLLSLETAKAERKLQNEIFPDLLRSRNYQRNKMGFEQMEEGLAWRTECGMGKDAGQQTVGRQHERNHCHG